MNELMSGTYLLNIGTDLFALIILIVPGFWNLA